MSQRYHWPYAPNRHFETPQRVVLHEVAHQFGVSDQRLIELDRY
jgi:predicted Zn-dependent protease with MMP-like domain